MRSKTRCTSCCATRRKHGVWAKARGRTALERFHIDRFAQDWHEALLHVTA